MMRAMIAHYRTGINTPLAHFLAFLVDYFGYTSANAF